ncbi:MAG: hydroxymethylbilane synthase [Chthoniobacterales bacterium]
MAPMTGRIMIGTRGSDLALAQTRMVASLLAQTHPALDLAETIIRTTGDRRLDVALSNPGPLDKGLFTKELERALIDSSIDAAVHSLKDLPTENPEGLVIGAILERESPDDVLVSKYYGGLVGLPGGATVATGSLRRKFFLEWQRPDIHVVEIRGNVPTRIKKLRDQSGLDALVLAAAGMGRLETAGCALGLDLLHRSDLDFMLPAPGQGAVAVQCRADDSATLAALAALHHQATAVCVTAERAVLSGLGGGCHMPLGVRATVDDGVVWIRAAWFDLPGAPPRVASGSAPMQEWTAAASDVINQLYGQIE